MRARIALCLLLSAVLPVGCTRPIRNGPIITEYKDAECIPPRLGQRFIPPTHTWDYALTTAPGQTVRVSGAQMPGGRIDVHYESDGADVIAANAGDYIYPADVRIDKAKQRLLVKASGITAAFSVPQTWLFEFDLTRRSEID